MRALHTGRALKRVGTTSVIVVGSEARDVNAMTKTSEEFTVVAPILPELSPKGGIVQRLRWICDSGYMNLHGYVAPVPERERLESILSDFDLVWILNSRTPNILQRWQWSRTHLDIDDVPSTYLRSVYRNGSAILERCKARIQQSIFFRREVRFVERFTTLSVCSPADKAYLGGGDRIHVIPNGFERPAVVPARNPLPQEPRIGFIGLYSYAPNLDGARWFLSHCWPAIRRDIPGVRFRLIGRDTDGPLQPREPGVDALGWVDDPQAEISTWSAMIIPIRFGGGTRIKLADAFSRKCPVVSTRLGAFGYEVQDGIHLRLADEPLDFAQACVELIRNPQRGSQMADLAWHQFLEKWTWDAIAPKVCAAAEDCLRRNQVQRN